MRQKPLTPLSTEDYRSPLDDARAEIARLHKEVTRLKQKPVAPYDTRLLDLQLRSAAYRKFIVANGLWAEFKRLNPALDN